MIWLLFHPHPLIRQQVVSLSQSSCVPSVELTDRRGGQRVEEEPNHTPARKPDSLQRIQYSLETEHRRKRKKTFPRAGNGETRYSRMKNWGREEAGNWEH